MVATSVFTRYTVEPILYTLLLRLAWQGLSDKTMLSQSREAACATARISFQTHNFRLLYSILNNFNVYQVDEPGKTDGA
jgi:hypothetical protein